MCLGERGGRLRAGGFLGPGLILLKSQPQGCPELDPVPLRAAVCWGQRPGRNCPIPVLRPGLAKARPSFLEAGLVPWTETLQTAAFGNHARASVSQVQCRWQDEEELGVACGLPRPFLAVTASINHLTLRDHGCSSVSGSSEGDGAFDMEVSAQEELSKQ